MATAATQQAQSGGLKAYFEASRVLQTYPTGWSRWWMLTLTVLATIVSYYEFGFSAMLPLWMPALHFTLGEFGWFLTCVVFLSGFSAMSGGPLPARHGRVVVTDLCPARMIALPFANLLIPASWPFVALPVTLYPCPLTSSSRPCD